MFFFVHLTEICKKVLQENLFISQKYEKVMTSILSFSQNVCYTVKFISLLLSFISCLQNAFNPLPHNATFKDLEKEPF